MFIKILLRDAIIVFCLMVSTHAAAAAEEVVEDLSLGRAVPAYFKVLTFDPAEWREFADSFPDHLVAQDIKRNIDSIQLAPLVLDKDAIFACPLIKQKMRDMYDKSFRGERAPAPSVSVVDSKGMFDGILTILQTNEGDVPGFKASVAEIIAESEKVIAAYNQRLTITGGNSGLLKHLLGKIFFADDAYTNPVLSNMRMLLLTYDLVAGDDQLFADKKDPTHTLANSLSKYMELEGVTDTLVIGCGRSLIADVAGTATFFADEFLKSHTKRTFVHSCQHCLHDHNHQLTVALYEPGATADYDGSAHADIAADALTPAFWATLTELKKAGKAPIKHVIDHSYAIDGLNPMIHSALDVGGTFTTYADYTGKIEEHGFMLDYTRTFGSRIEYTYAKVR